MKDIRAGCDQYHPDNVFNVDDTGLFYRLFLKRSYIDTHERRKTSRGTRGIKVKDRLSTWMWTNATDSAEVAMVIIGRS